MIKFGAIYDYTIHVDKTLEIFLIGRFIINHQHYTVHNCIYIRQREGT